MLSAPWLPSKREERRHILSISLPLITAYLAEMGMLITDMIIVGRLGGVELAAVGLGADWFYVLLLIGIGVLSIVGVLIAQSLGQGDDSRVFGYVRQGIIAATLLSIPVGLLSWYLSPLIGLTPQDPLVLQRIDEYMKPLTLSVWPSLIYVVFRNYLTALEKTQSLMVLMLGGLVLNAFLNVVLVHGLLGLPKLGVAGAGIGTSIVHWLLLVLLVIHISRHYIEPRQLVSKYFDGLAQLKELLYLGLPISATHLMGAGMFTVAAVFTGMLGAGYLAAQQLVYTLIYIAISIGLGFGDAAKVRVAYGLGKGSKSAMRQSAAQCIAYAVAVGVVFAVLLLFFPKLLVSVFLDISDPANGYIITLILSISIYAAFFQIFDTFNVVISSALRGLRDTRTPMWSIAVTGWIIGLGLAWYLGFTLGKGIIGVWQGLFVGVVLNAMIMVSRFVQQTRPPK